MVLDSQAGAVLGTLVALQGTLSGKSAAAMAFKGSGLLSGGPGHGIADRGKEKYAINERTPLTLILHQT